MVSVYFVCHEGHDFKHMGTCRRRPVAEVHGKQLARSLLAGVWCEVFPYILQEYLLSLTLLFHMNGWQTGKIVEDEAVTGCQESIPGAE